MKPLRSDTRRCLTEASPQLRPALHFVPALRLFKNSEVDILEVILPSFFFPLLLGFATAEARNPQRGARYGRPRRSSVRGPQEGARPTPPLPPAGAARRPSPAGPGRYPAAGSRQGRPGGAACGGW